MARILALSSHVVRGNVGLAVAVPALQALGHEVWALPTITLAARPGLGLASAQPGGRRASSAAELAGLLDALEKDGCWPMLDAVLAGYFGSADTVIAAADAIRRIRTANKSVCVLVDPILGDAGRLYVPPSTAEAIRDRLLPLADIATPNRFELQWLTGTGEGSDPRAAARALGPREVIVTSARETAQEVATLLLGQGDAIEIVSARVERVPNGSGDLLDGLLLGHILNGLTVRAALDASLAQLSRVLAASAGKDVLELRSLHEAGWRDLGAWPGSN